MDCRTAQNMVTSYIRRELSDKELEEFIDHIRDCQECHEELEIYFTIHFALQKLDEEKNLSYNIQKMLEDDLHAANWKVHRRKILRIWNYGVILAAELCIILVLLTQAQAWQTGSYGNTLLYQAVYGNSLVETEEREILETEENTERETAEESSGKKKSTEK